MGVPRTGNSLRGKVVVVTGASGGVGRATARLLAERGAVVALLARGGAGLDAAAREVVQKGGHALPVPVDVADHAALDAAAKQVVRTFGAIDVWINVAFATVFGPFEKVTPEEFERATRVTYLGFVWGTRIALGQMREQGRGTIVQTGSAMAYRGIPLQAVYSGAKHAVQGFTEAVRCELLHEKSPISITMVQLPALNTPQFDWSTSRMPEHPQPVPPIYQPEIAAAALVHAAEHPRRREYWVGESTALTLLGNKFAAGLADRYLARTGYRSQQDAELEPTSAENLWEPADDAAGGDYGAHGAFDSSAHAHSPQVWASRHYCLTALACAAAAVGGALTAVLARRSARA
jgi:NAD(P)-dependent dehydrogenase (short-subunit alcohol dehydrogenase family)